MTGLHLRWLLTLRPAERAIWKPSGIESEPFIMSISGNFQNSNIFFSFDKVSSVLGFLLRWDPQNLKTFCKIFLSFLGIIIYGVISDHLTPNPAIFDQSGAKIITENRKNRFCRQFLQKYCWPLDGARSKFPFFMVILKSKYKIIIFKIQKTICFRFNGKGRNPVNEFQMRNKSLPQ